MQFCLGALNNVLYVFLLKVSSFTRYYVCKKACLYLWSHQHVTGKTVISLVIQQNIDLLQRVTLKSVDFRVKLNYNFDFALTCDRKDVNFTQITTQNYG